MIFCGETILHGQRNWVQLPVPDARPLECVCLCGKNPGRTLVVTAGVHGCEYVGVQALRTLAQELDPSAMTGNAILLPLANPYGFYAGAKRVVPEGQSWTPAGLCAGGCPLSDSRFPGGSS